MRQLLDTLIASPFFTAANAFAGLYATVVWGFFAFIRFRTRQWLYGFIDLQLMFCAGVVGIAYTFAAMGHPDARLWLISLRLVVTPLLVFPSLLLITHWRQIHKVVGKATDRVEEFVERRDES